MNAGVTISACFSSGNDGISSGNGGFPVEMVVFPVPMMIAKKKRAIGGRFSDPIGGDI